MSMGKLRRPAELEWLLLLALLAYGLAPIVYLLLRAASRGQIITGADSVFAGDQLQYMAWIRSAGEHVLAADDYDLRLGAHDFLHPMFALSGLLWRAGVGMALSFLVWLPVAVCTLFFGFRQYTRRLVGSGRAQVTALALAIFFVPFNFGAPLGELAPTNTLYGYLPSVIAVGLIPLVLLGLERVVGSAGSEPPPIRWQAVVGVSLLGGLAAWLHPWQGETLLVIVALLLITERFQRRFLVLLVPAAVTAAPLAYYVLLSRADAAWGIAQTQAAVSARGFLVLVAILIPVLVLTVIGLRRPRNASTHRRLLLLWVPSALAVYLISTTFPSHALEGLSLPLAVLALDGWGLLRLPRPLGLAMVAIATIPGLIVTVNQFRQITHADPQAMLISSDERSALSYIERTSGSGGVLASLRLAAAVPAYTGHRVWVGHPSWTPNFAGRATLTSDLFAGRLPAGAAQTLLRRVGARYLLDDCERGLYRAGLGTLLVSERKFGCVIVYKLRVRADAAAA